jgi:hypothetical protein
MCRQPETIYSSKFSRTQWGSICIVCMPTRTAVRYNCILSRAPTSVSGSLLNKRRIALGGQQLDLRKSWRQVKILNRPQRSSFWRHLISLRENTSPPPGPFISPPPSFPSSVSYKRTHKLCLQHLRGYVKTM